jgi:succinate-semialdehyde dehydrogenase / glutarate-semialdehyde dehydrogenase
MATATAHHYATVNPYTGEVAREFDSLDAAAVDRAVETAHRASGAWRDRPIEERAAIVHGAAQLLAEQRDRLAALVTLEMGKRIVDAREEADLSSQILAYYGRHGPGLAAPRPIESDAGDAVLLTEPLGPLLTVQPWNYPLYQVARIAAPNLVLGNTILLKHASSCPQSALALEQVFRDAGVPAGVFTNLFLETADIAAVI